MWIKNFMTYAEKALRWSTTPYRDERTGRSTYLDSVVKKCCDALGIDTSESTIESPEDVDVRGIAVDLSSFCHWCIISEVKANTYNAWDYKRGSRVTASCSVNENSTDPMADAFGERSLDSAFRSVKRKCGNVFDDLENSWEVAQYEATLDRTVVLKDSVIDACAQRCFEKLFEVIGQDAITNAHYFTLHYDINVTSCKRHEQNRRRSTSAIVVQRESVCRVYSETIQLVRARLIFDLKNQLSDELQSRLRGYKKEDTERISKLLCDKSFINDAVSEKMQRPDHIGVVMRQRYLSGEGEWKCFYGIIDATTKDAPSRWHVFGNDSDIAVGMLLYTSPTTVIRYVNASRNVLSSRSEGGLAFKALHFFSLCLLGNDYIPRMVNESVANITALGAEVDGMISSSDEVCRRHVGVLAEIFQDSAMNITERSVKSTDSSDFCRAAAYVFARLLLAVYDDGKRGVVEVGKESRLSERDQSPITIPRIPLRCALGTERSFNEYFSEFALRAMWYLTYCLFYAHMDEGGRKEFRNERTEGKTRQLFIPGLVMNTPFEYNERRLQESGWIQLSGIVEIRRAIKYLTVSQLIYTFQKEMLAIVHW